MRIIHQMGAQGDVLLRRVELLPADAREVPRDGPVVVTHSETGHNHVIEADGVVHFESSDPLVCYLVLESIEHADLEHRRTWDTHDTLRLVGNPAGTVVWEARRQREYTPAGLRRVED